MSVSRPTAAKRGRPRKAGEAGNIASMWEHRGKIADAKLTAGDKALTSSLLRQATDLVRKHFPAVKINEAWTYHFTGDHWAFYGPDGYVWEGSAVSSFDTRYQGWMHWLATKGIT